MRSALTGLLVLAAAAGAAPFAPCCAYGGSGGAVALGTGVLNAFAPTGSSGSPPSGPGYAAPMAVGISPTRLFSTVLFAAASGPDDSAAGWIVTSNATADVIYVFANVSAAGPRCSAGVGPRGSYSADYRLCGGGDTFPRLVRDFALTPAVRVGVFAQDNNATTISLADESACAPLSILGGQSPFGTGAWSAAFESGVAAEPPVTWSAPPAYCEGHWETPGAGGIVESMRKA